MTPAARVSAAIEILDQILDGAAAEQALTRWARASRFAGSGDRAAVRDHVFDAMRRKRSASALGGAATGRGMMLGLLRQQEADPEQIFTGARHAPAPLSDAERQPGPPEGFCARHDLPDWIEPEWRASLGADAPREALALRTRAPVFLRVNSQTSDRANACAILAETGILAEPDQTAPHALRVSEGARRIRASRAYLEGLVELQDAASQAVVATLPADASRVLDYCAGGGGKTLALAAHFGTRIAAWDAYPARMQDLPARAKRAGADVQILDHAPTGAWDLVFCDAPCSGSGSWRRSPDGKWRLTEDRLTQLNAIQDQILHRAAGLVAPGGVLAYATCSVLACENTARIDAFLQAHPGWSCRYRHQYVPSSGPDGFFVAHLTQS